MRDDSDPLRVETWPALLKVLFSARSAVPAVDYALGIAGVAAAAALVTAFLGNGRITFIIVGAMLVAMVLLFVFSRLVVAKSRSIVRAGILLLWTTTLFFCTFLLLTVTAVAIAWPPTWAKFLGLPGLHEGHSDKPVPRQIQGSSTTGPCSPVITGSGADLKFEGNCTLVIPGPR